MSSRDLILGRVRRAIADVPQDDTPYEQAVARDYLREHGARSVAETVDLLAENLADYRALVHRTDTEELPDLIMRLLAQRARSTYSCRRGCRPSGCRPPIPPEYTTVE